MCVSNSLVFFCLHFFVFVVCCCCLFCFFCCFDLYDDHTDAVVGLLLGWNKKRNLKNLSYITNFALKLSLGGSKI